MKSIVKVLGQLFFVLFIGAFFIGGICIAARALDIPSKDLLLFVYSFLFGVALSNYVIKKTQ